MKVQSTANLTAPATVAPALPLDVMETLASRFRPNGLCLVVLKPDGSTAWQDGSCSQFFTRYAVPLIQRPPDAALGEKLAKIASDSPVAVWNCLPGVLLAGFPYVVRRQVQAIVMLVGKDCSFRLGEEVVRSCNQLGVDGVWLSQQAEHLPGCSTESIQRQTRLLLGTLRDQVRLVGLEQEMDSLSAQLANTYEELSLVYQLSGGMKVNRRASEFFRQACLDVMEVTQVHAMGVSLRDGTHEDQAPMLFGRLGLSPEQAHRLSAQLLDAITLRKAPLLINNLSTDADFRWMAPLARQILAVPLQRQDEVLGCLFVIDKPTGEFDSVDAKLLLSIANESAIYLQNAMLFQDVRGLMMGLLHSLTSAVDVKDSYTCGHSERVALLSRHLALRLNFPEQEVERIYMAGLLHDVGKIGVSENVLQKAGRLTIEEFEQMKRHPEIGARILQEIPQMRDVIPGVLHHHERYDGHGYPAKLSGLNIPLMGRIICLADCFDAMTSSRTYRLALPLEVALCEIHRCSGTQFDPALAEAFLAIGVNGFRDLLADHHRQTKRLLDLQQSLRSF